MSARQPVVFAVTLAHGTRVQVRAHYVRVVHGALAFYGESEDDLVEAFGPGAWHNVRKGSS